MIKMAEFDNENQEDGEVSNGDDVTGRNFGEVEERDDSETQGDGSEAAEETSDGETTGEGSTDDTEGESTKGKKAKAKDSEEGEPELTEKGTKKDPNPLSAAHQELANERKTRSQMEQVLANPDLLAKFMEKQYGIKIAVPSKDGEGNGKATAPEVKQFTAKDFENLDDVANVVNGIQSSFMSKIKEQAEIIQELGTIVHGMQQGGNAQRLYTTMSEDVAQLQKEPELNPDSPDFIEGLEQEIAGLYKKLDFDEKTQTYRGQYSIAEIGKGLIATARKARAKGSQRAQTVVKNKSEGAVRTGTKVKEGNGADNSAPATSIAKGVAELFG